MRSKQDAIVWSYEQRPTGLSLPSRRGLCRWCLKRLDESAAIFTCMLWMNPSDNQGARFNPEEVRAGTPWEDRAEK